MSVVRNAAKDFLRPYVERGDSLESLLQSHEKCERAEYSAQIGGSIIWNNRQRTIPNDKVAVTKVQGVPYFEIFPLKQLYKELKAEIAETRKPKQLELLWKG
jgi:hypothetical protein